MIQKGSRVTLCLFGRRYILDRGATGKGANPKKTSTASGKREGEGGSGYSRYDSKGLKGNLMAIRRQVDAATSTRVDK